MTLPYTSCALEAIPGCVRSAKVAVEPENNREPAKPEELFPNPKPVRTIGKKGRPPESAKFAAKHAAGLP